VLLAGRAVTREGKSSVNATIWSIKCSRWDVNVTVTVPHYRSLAPGTIHAPILGSSSSVALASIHLLRRRNKSNSRFAGSVTLGVDPNDRPQEGNRS